MNTTFPATGRRADSALAYRDHALPGLADLLENERLSTLLGEPVHITRVRYKPRTSLLVAFRRTRDGRHEYGWAATRAGEGDTKLARRAEASRAAGGSIVILNPDTKAPIATGSVEDDWNLRPHLLWYRAQGAGQLHIPTGSACSARTLTGRVDVLRYKPERRIVLRTPAVPEPVIVKVASHPLDHRERSELDRQRHRHGVPVLPELGTVDCALHGITASPAWGDADLGIVDDGRAAYRAGEALAALHSIPLPAETDTSRWIKDLADELTAARTMISALLPELGEPCAKLASTLLHRLTSAPNDISPVRVHGDFSPDQVLVNGNSVRLIDFDRTRILPAEADLGSFAAAEAVSRARGTVYGPGPKSRSLLDGYLAAGGTAHPAKINAWVSLRMFTASVDHFRDRDRDWPQQVAWHLATAMELIT